MAVVIETTVGDITVDLFLQQRPVTCLNFLKLCKMKYYNFNLFHSIRSGFIAQTGDPTGGGNGGESIFGLLEGPEKRFFSGEKMPKIRHTDTGMLSMVGTGDMMIGSQFFFTLGSDLDSLDGNHCVIGEVTEGHEVLRKLNEVICDETHRPYQDVRITHIVVLEDPYNDPAGFRAPSRSPSPSAERLRGGRIAPDEVLDDTQGKSAHEIQEIIEEKEAKARATILEMVGDLPDADIAPPENVLFVCKLNPVTTDEDLEIIFSRFGKIVSCEVIRDKKTGDSLQYAFIEFSDKKSCEDAYFKMDNVLIDDRRIHVDFSQSVSKIKWLGKGRGVRHLSDDEVNTENNFVNKSHQPKSNERDRVEQTNKYHDRDQNRQRTDNRRNRDENHEKNRNRDEKPRDRYRDQRENYKDKRDKKQNEKERDRKREDKERDQDDNRDDRGRNGNHRETEKRIDKRENVQNTDDKVRKRSDKERHNAEKRQEGKANDCKEQRGERHNAEKRKEGKANDCKAERGERHNAEKRKEGKANDCKEDKGNKNHRERNDDETDKNDKRRNREPNNEDKNVREKKREERDRERKRRDEKEPIRRDRSRSRSKVDTRDKMRKEANYHMHSDENDEVSKSTHERNHSIEGCDSRKLNQSNSHESQSKDTPEKRIRSESTISSKKYEDKSKNRHGDSKKNDHKQEKNSAVKRSKLDEENVQDSNLERKDNSAEKSTESKKKTHNKRNESKDLAMDKPGRNNKTAKRKKENEKKLQKKSKPKKKRKDSTSSSDSESSSSSSSSSESSSSSDSDKKKKRIKGRKRKASTSSSSSSSDSSTSSSSDSSSESSSSTSDSATKSKKTKNSKKKLGKKTKKK